MRADPADGTHHCRSAWRIGRLAAFVTNANRDNSRTGNTPSRSDSFRAIASASPKARAPQDVPLRGFYQNRIWCAMAQLACELIAWVQMLAKLSGEAGTS